ncbi:MAG TPA: heavy metal-binding domain-containing protein, partial [Propionibacteriaceae bacterium]|nr:heavy metal-binding domain-containing protein [Propionibacteriaceae bacterium]
VGTVTRPRDLQPHPELALFLTQIRQDATRAMVEMARQAGADAIIGFAYAGGAISSMSSEITAYGTAVTLEPVPDEPAIAVPAPATTASEM